MSEIAVLYKKTKQNSNLGLKITNTVWFDTKMWWPILSSHLRSYSLGETISTGLLLRSMFKSPLHLLLSGNTLFVLFSCLNDI